MVELIANIWHKFCSNHIQLNQLLIELKVKIESHSSIEQMELGIVRVKWTWINIRLTRGYRQNSL